MAAVGRRALTMDGMASGAQVQPLPGGRWHGRHGPIDLVVGADGDAAALAAAHAEAHARFAGVLAELVAELSLLRQAVQGDRNPLSGPIARRMWDACRPFAADGFITPMAAVAGAVAQELVAAYRRHGIRRAWVNNGGDIALYLAPGEQTTVGLFADLSRLDGSAAAAAAQGALPIDGRFVVRAGDPVRGIATSGWRGRSFSLGIADSVTVLAATAAMADAAATVVANAVDLEPADARVVRRPASMLRDDTDLGDRRVTVDVPPLPVADVAQALGRGQACAHVLQSRGLIQAAVLVCQGQALRCLAHDDPVPSLAS